MSFFKGFQKGMKDFGFLLPHIINSVLLFVVYLVGVGLTSLVAKLVGKHFLELSQSNTDSYWTDLNLKKKKKEEYYRQF